MLLHFRAFNFFRVPSENLPIKGFIDTLYCLMQGVLKGGGGDYCITGPNVV